MNNETLVQKNIPLPTIRRLPAYLQVLRALQEEKTEWASATVLAERLKLKAIQVRKDMNCTLCVGKPKLGFSTSELITQIENILGTEKISDVILVGVGNLGMALLKYKGFEKYDMKISAAFEVDPKMIDLKIGDVKIYDNSKLSSYIKKNHTKFAILAVPQSAAQGLADQLIASGITGIWNFSKSYLNVPSHVTVRQEDLALSLASLQAEVVQKTSQGK